jgi:hypothetical protein
VVAAEAHDEFACQPLAELLGAAAERDSIEGLRAVRELG